MWLVYEILNFSRRDRVADELGHRDATSSYPGKLKTLLSGILFLMLLTRKIGLKIMKKLIRNLATIVLFLCLAEICNVH